jgi:hypothetical protein
MIWWCLPRQPPLKPLLSKIAWIDTASGQVSRLIFLNQVSLSVKILTKPLEIALLLFFPSLQLQFLQNIWVFLCYLAGLNMTLLLMFCIKLKFKWRDGDQKHFHKKEN